MARLPDLIDVLARHDRRGKPTIAHIARQVRAGGLIESRTRGVGAAEMTFRDAAVMLMAVCGDSSPQGAVEAVKRLSLLQPAPWDDIDRSKRSVVPERLSFLADRLGFAESVERLIQHAPEVAQWESAYLYARMLADTEPTAEAVLAMQRTARKPFANGGPISLARPCQIMCQVPGVAAEIHLGLLWRALDDDLAFHEYYAPPKGWLETLDNQTERAVWDEYDCAVTMEVGLPVILDLHFAVSAPSGSRWLTPEALALRRGFASATRVEGFHRRRPGTPNALRAKTTTTD